MAGVKPSAISSATVAAFKTKLGYLTQEEADLRYPQISEGEPVDLDALLAAKADLASPTFTGIPLVPTADAGTNTTQVANTAFVNSTNNTLRAYQALGTTIKAYPLGMMASIGQAQIAMVDGTYYITPIYVDYTGSITGCRIVLQTQGSFTADNYNGIGLYSVSGGTCTKVAETANDPNIWKQVASVSANIPFVTPYNIVPGIYYAVSLYNSSAQTTAPSVYMGASGYTANAISILGLSNSAKLGGSLAAQTVLPTSFTFSSLTVFTGFPMVVLY